MSASADPASPDPSSPHLPSDDVPASRAALKAAVEAARRAADLIRKRAGAAGVRRQKDLKDFVTETDLRAQEIITEYLAEAFPSIGVLAEEGADLEAVPHAPEGARWIIDPIDGTTNFMHGVPPYAVSIALQRAGRMEAGVVLEVAGGACYTTVRGDGAFCDGEPIHVSAESDSLDEALVATGYPYRALGHLERYTDVLRRAIRATQGVRRHGAASVDLARVAGGQFEAFFETGLQPWDVAAGMLLVEEAGGRVTDYRGDRPEDADAAGAFLFAGQILATNGSLHAPMCELVQPMQDVRE